MKLRARLYIQSIFFSAVLGTCLFLPSLTFDYCEAWIYWAIFTLSNLILGEYLLKTDRSLLERRLKAAKGEESKTQRWIQLFAGLSFLLLILFPGIDHRFQWSQIPKFLVFAADGLVVVGFIIVFLVFRENSFTSSIIEVETSQKVVSTGPYRFVRHPMYSGAIILIAATPIALGSYWALIFIFPLIVTIILRLLNEETFLLRHLNGYQQYQQQTKYRLIPGLW